MFAAIADRYSAHVRRRHSLQPRLPQHPTHRDVFGNKKKNQTENNTNINIDSIDTAGKRSSKETPRRKSEEAANRGDAFHHSSVLASFPVQEAPPPSIAAAITTSPTTTVDAGTQYSRPATPSTPLVQPASASACDPPQRQAADSLDARLAPSMPAPAPAVVGSKRNTPDAATTTTAAAAPPTSEPKIEPKIEPKTGEETATELKAETKADKVGNDSAEGDTPAKRRRAPKPAPRVLPNRYEDASPRDLVVLISSMLLELIRFNDQIPLRDGSLTRFHSRSPPRISVHDYLQRLATHATLSPPILLSMVYYIDRLCALYPAFTISSLTVHRFLISSATVASKGLSDSFWTNKTYARVGGISVAELALLELEFLWRVEWRIVPQPEVLQDYYRSLVDRCDEYVLEDDPEPGPNNPEKPAGNDNGQNEPPSVVKNEPPPDQT